MPEIAFQVFFSFFKLSHLNFEWLEIRILRLHDGQVDVLDFVPAEIFRVLSAEMA